MHKIVGGYHTFRKNVFSRDRDFFMKLAKKQQQPSALLITCSDSRIDPNLVTQTEPGDLFIIRNAGNIIPPHGLASSGESATVEYAIQVLQIPHIILCGHSHCGAIKALLEYDSNPSRRTHLPAVSQWFAHAEATRRIVRERYPHLEGDELLTAATEENVLVQLNNLSTHPEVSAALSSGAINLYGWRYEIETGTIYQYDQNERRFLPLNDEFYPTMPLALRAASHRERECCASGR